MATNTELTSLATGQQHKKAPVKTEALRSQQGDGSRQPRALLFHSLVLYGFNPEASGCPAQSQFQVTLQVQRLLSSISRSLH